MVNEKDLPFIDGNISIIKAMEKISIKDMDWDESGMEIEYQEFLQMVI